MGKKKKEKPVFCWHYTETAPDHVFLNNDVVFVCVGTDRSTGDCLGPLVGDMLQAKGIPNVYGTIDQPVHAMNIAEVLDVVARNHPEACVIGIDASLGKVKDVGRIAFWDKALEPGAGVGKDLPLVGQYAITGVVNVGGFNEHVVLSNTRLSLVWSLAESIVSFIEQAFPHVIPDMVATTSEAQMFFSKRVSKPKRGGYCMTKQEFLEKYGEQELLEIKFCVNDLADVLPEDFEIVEDDIPMILNRVSKGMESWMMEDWTFIAEDAVETAVEISNMIRKEPSKRT